MYEQGLALNNLQWLICHKSKPNQTNHISFYFRYFVTPRGSSSSMNVYIYVLGNKTELSPNLGFMDRASDNPVTFREANSTLFLEADTSRRGPLFFSFPFFFFFEQRGRKNYSVWKFPLHQKKYKFLTAALLVQWNNFFKTLFMTWDISHVLQSCVIYAFKI